MSTAATQQPPVPPRPTRSQERDQPGNLQLPKVPPRPAKRTISPKLDRYAPSPLNGGIPAKKDRTNSNDDPIDRSRSVELPAVVGEEGMEYAALAEELSSSRGPSTSPGQTRTIGEDIDIVAPKATMPASSAKQRIMQVTRTDSDKAAAFGIGRPSTAGSDIPTHSNHSLKKKASTASGLSHSESMDDEEHGIPEIGLQIPLYPNAGDVQAPSPAPGATPGHRRKGSSKNLLPGSYGLHGHNIVSKDPLDKEYYQKHPEQLRSERHPYQHDRPTDFSRSSEQLNKMVRDTEITGLGVGTHDHVGTPSEQAGWAAYEQIASRPGSTKSREGSPLRHGSKLSSDKDVIVVEEPNKRRSVLFSDEATPAPLPLGGDDYDVPILAEDEVRKNISRPDQVPAMELPRDYNGSEEMEPPRSRPTSRPTSLYKVESAEMRSTPLENVREYEPLFPDDDESGPEKLFTAAKIKEMKQRFPSHDIWEDAPNSVHYTATVTSPELAEEEDYNRKDVPSREQAQTPAHAFARQQEELAEKELTHPDAFLWRNQRPPTYVANQSHLSQGMATREKAPTELGRPNIAQRFPSRDIWEDTPDSLKLEATVSGPQEAASPADSRPQVPGRPQRKSTDPKEKPTIPDRPKPQVPVRPAKASASASTASADAPVPKAKPAVPARPMANKIAALQAGFMSDLNKKLGLGPQAPKKDEPKEEVAEELKEKAPLSDARRGRARGPQRRAPTAAAPPAASKPAAEKPKLSFATTVTVWSIDPDDDYVLKNEGVFPDEVEEKAAAPVVEATTEEEGGKVETEAKEKAEPEPEAEEERPAEEKPAEVVEKTEEEEDDEEEEKVEEAQEEEPIETKAETLATNMAGETVAEATVEVDRSESKVHPKEVDTNVVED